MPSEHAEGVRRVVFDEIFCFSDGVSRIDQAGCLSFITYAWVFSYLWSAFKGLIPTDAQWSCSVYDSANVNVSR